MRAAVYAAPAPGSTLARLAADWLGRDAFTGEATRPPDPRRDPLIADAARYGFHATLRAPFRPRHGDDPAPLAERLATLCVGRPAPVIRSLALGRLGAFFALVPAAPEPALAALEADVLHAFELFRAPLTPDERARRRPEQLAPRERELLDVWGYPFVLDAFRFHMTLTGPVPDAAADGLEAEMARHFAPVLGRPLRIDGAGLFVEPAPGAPFRVHSFHPFGPPAALDPATTP